MGCVVRVVWLFGGIAALILLLVPIVIHDIERLSFVSIGFWVVVGLIVVARYADVMCFAGTMPSDGTPPRRQLPLLNGGLIVAGHTPATLSDANRFSAVLVIIASAVWVLAHAL